MDEPSVAEQLAALDEEARRRALDGLDPEQRGQFLRHWEFWARGNQKQPGGMWRIWLIMAGRGYGKTRAGAEWVRNFASRHGLCRIALVGATQAEARAIMVEGESGLLEVSRGLERPRFEPSLGRLVWPNLDYKFPFALSLSKGCTFFPTFTEEGQGFDRLSPNGFVQ